VHKSLAIRYLSLAGPDTSCAISACCAFRFSKPQDYHLQKHQKGVTPRTAGVAGIDSEGDLRSSDIRWQALFDSLGRQYLAEDLGFRSLLLTGGDVALQVEYLEKGTPGADLTLDVVFLLQNFGS
jgi:hypothetical protein